MKHRKISKRRTIKKTIRRKKIRQVGGGLIHYLISAHGSSSRIHKLPPEEQGIHPQENRTLVIYTEDDKGSKLFVTDGLAISKWLKSGQDPIHLVSFLPQVRNAVGPNFGPGKPLFVTTSKTAWNYELFVKEDDEKVSKANGTIWVPGVYQLPIVIDKIIYTPLQLLERWTYPAYAREVGNSLQDTLNVIDRHFNTNYPPPFPGTLGTGIMGYVVHILSCT